MNILNHWRFRPGYEAGKNGDLSRLSSYARQNLDSMSKNMPEEIRPAYERACAAEPQLTRDM